MIMVDGYKWFGLNRRNLHKNAKKGSGGIGLLIKDILCQDYNVFPLEASSEEIMWLVLQHKSSGDNLIACVCYLPPMKSSRQADGQNFFDSLMTDIVRYQNMGKMFICGDYNSRCGDLVDYIHGVDAVKDRDVIDFNTNKYGHLSIDFLLNCNMCMLNGRSCLHNDYTCSSVNGYSVVDYCIINHDDLSMFTDFIITNTADLINSVGDFLLNCNMCMLNGRSCLHNDYTCSSVNGYSVVDYCIINHDDLSMFTDFIITNTADLINSVGHDTVLISASIPDHSQSYRGELPLVVYNNYLAMRMISQTNQNNTKLIRETYLQISSWMNRVNRQFT